jgi:hypothetical protein
LLLGKVIGEGIRVDSVLNEGKHSNGRDVRDLQVNLLLSRIFKGKVERFGKVIRVVEGEARWGQQNLCVGSIVSLQETAALLRNWGEEVVKGLAIVEELRVCAG